MEEHIHESNLIEGIDDIKADRESLEAWKWLINQPSIDQGVIMKLQKRLTTRQKYLLPNQRGYYRGMAGNHTNVRVGGRICPNFTEVRGLMAAWLKTYKKNTPIVNHIEFEKIHPFVDGNGRTGRMLMWYQEIKDGDLPTLWMNDEKHVVYYPMFR